MVENQEIPMSTGIGIAFSSPDYEQPEDVLRDASMAMHYAKELDRKRTVVFDPFMQERARERQQIRFELPRAIENGELCIYYQPIVELASGKIAGFEALVRWQHPERGLLSPGAFIPIAEHLDIIVPFDQWVLQEVCRQARAWTSQLALTSPLNIYINLSGRAFRNPELVPYIQNILAVGDMGVFRLKLEITEGIMMDNADSTIATLQHLRNLGIELCIDDFGTGYSSLRYLQRFPVQTVKIDHSFIEHLGDEQENESTHIVKAILLMAHALDMNVVAEWIETPDQLAQLEAMGCEYGQGFLFSRPLDAVQAEHVLAHIDETIYTRFG
jgi:EAL domain-containing protein (putative c-di-GMP-specific phosphodiesterase class I)